MNKELIAQFLNHYLSFATVIGMAMLVLFSAYIAYAIYLQKSRDFVMLKIGHDVLEFLAKYVLPLGFLITFVGVAMSLFYSEYIGYAPCDLCWVQRIFLYPQMFMFAYAWYKKDRNVLPYVTLLSVIGFVIAVYHHMLQIGYDMYKPCSTSPFAVDCAKPLFVEYGFVTFPLMSAVLFGYIVAMVVVAKKFAK